MADSLTCDPGQPSSADEPEAFVTFGLGTARFAVAVAHVREVLDVPPIADLPNAPHGVAGMIDVRGQNVPVVSLRAKFGLGPRDVDEETRILVVEVARPQGALVLGAMCDRVFEVTQLDERPIEDMPDLGVQWDARALRGVARQGTRFVIVLDLAEALGDGPAMSPAGAGGGGFALDLMNADG